MEKYILVTWGCIATCIYGYGSFIAARYHESIFDGPAYWILIDLITLAVFWRWYKKSQEIDCEMRSQPTAFLGILLFVTLVGFVDIIFPRLVNTIFPPSSNIDFPFLNFVVAIGAGYHSLNEITRWF